MSLQLSLAFFASFFLENARTLGLFLDCALTLAKIAYDFLRKFEGVAAIPQSDSIGSTTVTGW
jgi:hypothetical protein